MDRPASRIVLQTITLHGQLLASLAASPSSINKGGPTNTSAKSPVLLGRPVPYTVSRPHANNKGHIVAATKGPFTGHRPLKSALKDRPAVLIIVRP